MDYANFKQNSENQKCAVSQSSPCLTWSASIPLSNWAWVVIHIRFIVLHCRCDSLHGKCVTVLHCFIDVVIFIWSLILERRSSSKLPSAISYKQYKRYRSYFIILKCTNHSSFSRSSSTSGVDTGQQTHTQIIGDLHESESGKGIIHASFSHLHFKISQFYTWTGSKTICTIKSGSQDLNNLMTCVKVSSEQCRNVSFENFENDK